MSPSRNWLRRGAVTTTLALTAAGLFAAFGAGSSGATNAAASSRPANKIVVLAYGDAQNPAEQYAVDAYNKTAEGKKVKAVLQTIPGADYQTKLQTLMGSSNAPDVFFNWGGGSITQFQKAGLLLPLNGFMKANPKLKTSFLPSILNAAKIGNNYYGIPMRGTQPVMLFYNKTVLAANNLTPPTTWADLLSDVATLKSGGVQVPIALGGADQWPTLMWFEYLYDRVAGPSFITNALAGQSSLWKTPASNKALADLAQLINAGGFGPSKSWDSVYFTKNQTAQMMIGGQAAFELMGSWDYSTLQSQSASFAASSLGYTAFPSIPGGKGNLNDLAGNTENYYSVLKKHAVPAGGGRLPDGDVHVDLRQEGAGARQPDDDDEHAEPDQRDDGALPEVPVRPDQEGPGVPAVLGPGLAADQLEHDPHCGCELLRQPRCKRV